MKYIAVIPARGGSKGIKNKNLQLVGEYSLVARAIVLAKSIEEISYVIVSTDDIDIAREAKKYGAEVHNRSKQSATDTARTVEVISEICKEYDLYQDTCVLLQPTSPLRTVQDVKASITKYQKNYQQGSVVTVTECEHHPYKTVILLDHEKYEFIRTFEDLEAPRQSLPSAYRVNGAVYVTSFEKILTNNSFFTEPQSFVKMSDFSSIDIDTQEDLNKANILLKKQEKV